jgi:hypothetical protein
MFVMLTTFVMFVIFRTFVMFTSLMYVSRQWYHGKNGSPGPSGNHAVRLTGPPPMVIEKLGPPTNATKAGA